MEIGGERALAGVEATTQRGNTLFDRLISISMDPCRFSKPTAITKLCERLEDLVVPSTGSTPRADVGSPIDQAEVRIMSG